MKTIKDLSYGTDALQSMDIYLPENSNAIGVVYIHGGGWSQGDKHKEVNLATSLVQEGFKVFIPNYRLAVGKTKKIYFRSNVMIFFLRLNGYCNPHMRFLLIGLWFGEVLRGVIFQQKKVFILQFLRSIGQG